jgi:hypothetical protein
MRFDLFHESFVVVIALECPSRWTSALLSWFIRESWRFQGSLKSGSFLRGLRRLRIELVYLFILLIFTPIRFTIVLLIIQRSVSVLQGHSRLRRAPDQLHLGRVFQDCVKIWTSRNASVLGVGLRLFFRVPRLPSVLHSGPFGNVHNWLYFRIDWPFDQQSLFRTFMKTQLDQVQVS